MANPNLSSFQEFLGVVKVATENDKEVLKLIQKRFASCSQEFLQTGDFRHLLQRTTRKIKDDFSNKYIHIKDFVTELKAYKAKGSNSSKRKTAFDSDTDKAENHGKRPRLGDTSDSTQSGRDSPLFARRTQVVQTKSNLVTSGPSNLSASHVTNAPGERISDSAVQTITSPGSIVECSDSKSENVIASVSSGMETCASIEEIVDLCGDDGKKPNAISKRTGHIRRCTTVHSDTSDLEVIPEGSSVKMFQTPSNKQQKDNKSKQDKVRSSSIKHQNGVASSSKHRSDAIVIGLDEPDDDVEITGLDNSRKTREKNKIKTDTHSESEAEIPSGKKSSRSRSEENVNNDLEVSDKMSRKERKKQRAAERQIKKLERFMKVLNHKIKKLEAREVSLEEMDDEDSSYILEEKYKKKLVSVWEKLCELKGREKTTGRPTEQKFKFEGSRYEVINKKIQRFVNKLRIFPDYADIEEIVSKCNIKYNLQLGKRRIFAISQEAFTEVGNQLQKRRINDFVESFGSHLTDNFRSGDDPAEYDRELQRKLEANQRESSYKMQQVFDEYVEKQTIGNFDNTDEDEEEEDEEEAKPKIEDKIPEDEDDEEDDFHLDSNDDDCQEPEDLKEDRQTLVNPISEGEDDEVDKDHKHKNGSTCSSDDDIVTEHSSSPFKKTNDSHLVKGTHKMEKKSKCLSSGSDSVIIESDRGEGNGQNTFPGTKTGFLEKLNLGISPKSSPAVSPCILYAKDSRRLSSTNGTTHSESLIASSPVKTKNVAVRVKPLPLPDSEKGVTTWIIDGQDIKPSPQKSKSPESNIVPDDKEDEGLVDDISSIKITAVHSLATGTEKQFEEVMEDEGMSLPKPEVYMDRDTDGSDGDIDPSCVGQQESVEIALSDCSDDKSVSLLDIDEGGAVCISLTENDDNFKKSAPEKDICVEIVEGPHGSEPPSSSKTQEISQQGDKVGLKSGRPNVNKLSLKRPKAANLNKSWDTISDLGSTSEIDLTDNPSASDPDVQQPDSSICSVDTPVTKVTIDPDVLTLTPKTKAKAREIFKAVLLRSASNSPVMVTSSEAAVEVDKESGDEIILSTECSDVHSGNSSPILVGTSEPKNSIEIDLEENLSQKEQSCLLPLKIDVDCTESEKVTVSSSVVEESAEDSGVRIVGFEGCVTRPCPVMLDGDNCPQSSDISSTASKGTDKKSSEEEDCSTSENPPRIPLSSPRKVLKSPGRKTSKKSPINSSLQSPKSSVANASNLHDFDSVSLMTSKKLASTLPSAPIASSDPTMISHKVPEAIPHDANSAAKSEPPNDVINVDECSDMLPSSSTCDVNNKPGPAKSKSPVRSPQRRFLSNSQLRKPSVSSTGQRGSESPNKKAGHYVSENEVINIDESCDGFLSPSCQDKDIKPWKKSPTRSPKRSPKRSPNRPGHKQLFAGATAHASQESSVVSSTSAKSSAFPLPEEVISIEESNDSFVSSPTKESLMKVKSPINPLPQGSISSSVKEGTVISIEESPVAKKGMPSVRAILSGHSPELDQALSLDKHSQVSGSAIVESTSSQVGQANVSGQYRPVGTISYVSDGSTSQTVKPAKPRQRRKKKLSSDDVAIVSADAAAAQETPGQSQTDAKVVKPRKPRQRKRGGLLTSPSTQDLIAHAAATVFAEFRKKSVSQAKRTQFGVAARRRAEKMMTADGQVEGQPLHTIPAARGRGRGARRGVGGHIVVGASSGRGQGGLVRRPSGGFIITSGVSPSGRSRGRGYRKIGSPGRGGRGNLLVGNVNGPITIDRTIAAGRGMAAISRGGIVLTAENSPRGSPTAGRGRARSRGSRAGSRGRAGRVVSNTGREGTVDSTAVGTVVSSSNTSMAGNGADTSFVVSENQAGEGHSRGHSSAAMIRSPRSRRGRGIVRRTGRGKVAGNIGLVHGGHGAADVVSGDSINSTHNKSLTESGVNLGNIVHASPMQFATARKRPSLLSRGHGIAKRGTRGKAMDNSNLRVSNSEVLATTSTDTDISVNSAGSLNLESSIAAHPLGYPTSAARRRTVSGTGRAKAIVKRSLASPVFTGDTISRSSVSRGRSFSVRPALSKLQAKSHISSVPVSSVIGNNTQAAVASRPFPIGPPIRVGQPVSVQPVRQANSMSKVSTQRGGNLQSTVHHRAASVGKLLNLPGQAGRIKSHPQVATVRPIPCTAPTRRIDDTNILLGTVSYVMSKASSSGLTSNSKQSSTTNMATVPKTGGPQVKRKLFKGHTDTSSKKQRITSYSSLVSRRKARGNVPQGVNESGSSCEPESTCGDSSDDHVISSSDQPPELGEPDSVIVLSDSD